MRFILNSSEVVKNCISALTQVNTDKPMIVTIKEYKKNRSNSQNNLYWEWLTIISKDTGFTKEELHDRLRLQFLGTTEREVNYKIDGKVQKVTLKEIKSTTELNTKEFTDYLEKIEATAGIMDIILPHPQDYYIAMEER